MGIEGQTLVIAAWDPELAPLRARLRQTPELLKTTGTRAVGVGLIEAGIGTTNALNERTRRPSAVVFIGTAGLYPIDRAELALGNAVLVRRIALLSNAVLRGDGYLPAPLPRLVATTLALRTALRRASRLPVADCACPLAITARKPAARRAARLTASAIENLEVFAAARACAHAGVPFAAVLGIANDTGPAAHRQWKAFATPAATAAGDAVFAWLVARLARPAAR